MCGGFTQIGLTKEAQAILALCTRRGLLVPKVLYFGPKQAPGVFQSLVGATFGGLRDEEGYEFASAFVDDCTVSTEGYDEETYDDVFERHIRQVIVFLTAAHKNTQDSVHVR